MNKRITIRLSDSLLAMLEVQANREHRDLSSLIRKVLCNHVEVPYHEKIDKTLSPELPLS